MYARAGSRKIAHTRLFLTPPPEVSIQESAHLGKSSASADGDPFVLRWQPAAATAAAA
jgi:hypothetical protein